MYQPINDEQNGQNEKRNKYMMIALAIGIGLIILSFIFMLVSMGWKVKSNINIDIEPMSPAITGITAAVIQGKIKTSETNKLLYYFEYSLGDYFSPNFTKTITMNPGDEKVNFFISNLQPESLYVFRIIAQVGQYYFSSDRQYFITLRTPDIIFQNYQKVNNSIKCHGEIKNYGSILLSYSGQLCTSNNCVTSPFKQVSLNGQSNSIETTFTNLTNKTEYTFRFLAKENNTDITYYGTPQVITF